MIFVKRYPLNKTFCKLAFMKILYGVNSNGQGHINRARVFINELQKDGHDVHVLFSGKQPPEYAYEIAPTAFYKLGPIDVYKDHKVDLSKTLQVNLGRLGKLTRNRRDLLELAEQEDYEVIFTDFEPTASVVGRILNKVVINIDHQHSAFHPANEEAPAKNSLKMNLKFAMRIMLPYYSHSFSLDFVPEISTVEDMTLFPLIWKPEFDRYKMKLGEHVLVYLARYNKDKMIKELTKIKDTTFKVYGFNYDDTINNVEMKKTEREGFIRDLTSAKFIITNGGFSLGWECCLANKLIWMIPHANNYEQLTNAYRLQKLGRAFVTEELTTEDMQEFEKQAEKIDYTPEINLPILPASVLMEQAYRQIAYHAEEQENKKRVKKRNRN